MLAYSDDDDDDDGDEGGGELELEEEENIEDDNDGEERVGFSVTDPSVNSVYSGTDFLSWKESVGKNILKKAFAKKF